MKLILREMSQERSFCDTVGNSELELDATPFLLVFIGHVSNRLRVLAS